jgi:NAD(P)-dependent dehydrogenase (short-subunit alcohol dehydrogenase family)
MTTAVVGATRHVGSEIVRGVLARGDPVAALVRSEEEARRVFGETDGLHIRRTRLDEPRDLIQALDGIRALFIAMGFERLIGARVPAGTAELLIAREWAIPAGENDYTTATFQQITGPPPPAPAGRVPSRTPSGVRLMHTREIRDDASGHWPSQARRARASGG